MSAPASFGLLLIRGIVGYVMFFHGAQKLFGWFDGPGMEAFIAHVPDLGLPGVPKNVLGYAAAISEFAGGILLMLGLSTRVAAVFVAATMGVAVFKVHWGEFALQKSGIEYAATLMLVAVGLLFTGPGRFALDNLFARRKKPATAKKD